MLGLVFELVTVVTVLSEALKLDAFWFLLSRRRCITGVVLGTAFLEFKTLWGDTNRRDLANVSGKQPTWWKLGKKKKSSFPGKGGQVKCKF